MNSHQSRNSQLISIFCLKD